MVAVVDIRILKNFTIFVSLERQCVQLKKEQMEIIPLKLIHFTLLLARFRLQLENRVKIHFI
jgi:hypothetical protein